MYAKHHRTAARTRAEIDAQFARMADDEGLLADDEGLLADDEGLLADGEGLLAEAKAMAEAGMEASWESLPLAEADEDHASAVDERQPRLLTLSLRAGSNADNLTECPVTCAMSKTGYLQLSPRRRSDLTQPGNKA